MCGSNSPGRASAFTRPLVQKANGYSGVSGVIIDTTGRYVSIVLVGKKYIMAHCIDVIARQTRNEKGEAYWIGVIGYEKFLDGCTGTDLTGKASL